MAAAAVAVSETTAPARDGKAYTELVTVTPKMAEDWLKANRGNRNPSATWVDSLARDILAGRWEIDGASIRFSKDGRLLDGQHRLLAIIKAGRPVQTLVTYGLKNSAMECIDRTRGRSVGDLFRINMGDRVQNGPRTAAILGVIANILNGSHASRMRLTYGEAQELYKTYLPDILWAENEIGYKMEPNVSSGGGPILGAFAFCRQIDIDKMEQLAYQFKHGEPRDGRSKMSSAARALRNAVTQSFDKSTGVRRQLVARALRCIEAHLKGEDLQIVKFDSNVIERMLKMRQAKLR